MSKGVFDPKLVNCFIAFFVAKGARMDTFELLSRLQRSVVFGRPRHENLHLN